MGVGLWSLLTALFRMIPRFPPARSARECATSAAPAHAGISRAVPRRCNPAHMLSSPETTPPETLTDTHPVPDVLTHHNLDAEPDRSRRGLRPISAQVSTDLEPELDRSRHGFRPISSRSSTDLDADYDRSRRHSAAQGVPQLCTMISSSKSASQWLVVSEGVKQRSSDALWLRTYRQGAVSARLA